jgi:hypothetical protein
LEASLKAEAAGRSGEAAQGIKAATEAEDTKFSANQQCDFFSHDKILYRIVYKKFS